MAVVGLACAAATGCERERVRELEEEVMELRVQLEVTRQLLEERSAAGTRAAASRPGQSPFALRGGAVDSDCDRGASCVYRWQFETVNQTETMQTSMGGSVLFRDASGFTIDRSQIEEFRLAPRDARAFSGQVRLDGKRASAVVDIRVQLDAEGLTAGMTMSTPPIFWEPPREPQPRAARERASESTRRPQPRDLPPLDLPPG